MERTLRQELDLDNTILEYINGDNKYEISDRTGHIRPDNDK